MFVVLSEVLLMEQICVVDNQNQVDYLVGSVDIIIGLLEHC